jgi:hypothetical protein
MIEDISLVQFSLTMEKFLERTEDAIIARNLLIVLRLEARELKDSGNLNKVNQERLVKLLSLLKQSIREPTNLSVSDVSFNSN